MLPASQAVQSLLKRVSSLPAATRDVLSRDLLSPWVLVDAFKVPVSLADSWLAGVTADTTLLNAPPGAPGTPPAVHHELLDTFISALRNAAPHSSTCFYNKGLGRTHLLPRFAVELTSARSGRGIDPPPAHMQWFEPSDRSGRPWCAVVNGCFPVSAAMRELLPPESWVAHFQLTIPTSWFSEGAPGSGSDAAGAADGAAQAAAALAGASSEATSAVAAEMRSLRPLAVVLPGTGEFGFERRRHIVSYPLARLGIATALLEGPQYGTRRPASQLGARLPELMDLCVIGRATIEEAISICRWSASADEATLADLAAGRLAAVNARATTAAKASEALTRPAPAAATTPAPASRGQSFIAPASTALGASAAAAAGRAAGGTLPVPEVETRVDGLDDAAAAAGESAGRVDSVPFAAGSESPATANAASDAGSHVASASPATAPVSPAELRLERDRISASIADGAVAAAALPAQARMARPDPESPFTLERPLANAADNSTANTGAGSASQPELADAGAPSGASTSVAGSAPLSIVLPAQSRAFGACVVAGTSMGGLHAAMTASCAPDLPLGVASWVGPPSASGVFTMGALAAAVDWNAIARDARKGALAAAVDWDTIARDARKGARPSVAAAAFAGLGASGGGGSASAATGAAASSAGAEMARLLAALPPQPRVDPAVLRGIGWPDAEADAAVRGGASHTASAGSFDIQSAAAHAASDAAATAAGAAARDAGLSPAWAHVVEMESLLAAAAPHTFATHDHEADVLRHHTGLVPPGAPQDALAYVARCLRITDITNFAPPRLPGAVAFVTATHDGYVPISRSLTSQWHAMTRLWPGCTVQQVVAGHVTASILQTDVYVGSILAVVRRLRRLLSKEGEPIAMKDRASMPQAAPLR